jgi:hypothetical protein
MGVFGTSWRGIATCCFIRRIVRGYLTRAWKKTRGMPATSETREAPKKSTRDFTVIG